MQKTIKVVIHNNLEPTEELSISHGQKKSFLVDMPSIGPGVAKFRAFINNWLEDNDMLRLSVNGWNTLLNMREEEVGGESVLFVEADIPTDKILEGKNTLGLWLVEEVGTSTKYILGEMSLYYLRYPQEVIMEEELVIDQPQGEVYRQRLLKILNTTAPTWADFAELQGKLAEAIGMPIELLPQKILVDDVEPIHYGTLDFFNPVEIVMDTKDPEPAVVPPGPPSGVPRLPYASWLLHDNKPQPGMEDWLGSHPDSLARNVMYVVDGKYQYENAETLAARIVPFDLIKDPAQQRVEGANHVQLTINYPLLSEQRGLYRAQLQLDFNQFTLHDLEVNNRRTNWMERQGFKNWYTAVGQTLVARFSFMIPEDVDLDAWPVLGPGMDNPASKQRFQCRSRYNLNGVDSNIPIDIYQQKDHFYLALGQDPRTHVYKEIDGQPGMHPKIHKIQPGEYVDFLVFMQPGQGQDGHCVVFKNVLPKNQKPEFTLCWEYQGDFYSLVNPKHQERQGLPNLYMGSPSYIDYGAPRQVWGRLRKWKEAMLFDKVVASPMQLFQFDNGEYTVEDIRKEAEANYLDSYKV